MSNFTPGPWEVSGHISSEYGNPDCCRFAIYESAGDTYQIATIMGDLGLEDGCRANANLIAASPDGYALAQECANHLYTLQDISRIRDMAKAFLSKAEGKQS